MDLNLDQAEINRMLRQPSGMVAQYIHEIGEKTVNEAQRRAPVRSGKLRRSIDISLWPGPGLSLEISANVSYALAVHQGTKAHTKKGTPLLAFPSKKKGGRMIAVKSVQQPATKGNPFLVNALRTTIPK